MLAAIRRNVTWYAIPVAGIVAGTVFLLALMGLSPAMLEVKGTLFLHYSAALVLGSDALTDNSSSVLITGLLVHAILSVLFALVIAIVVHQWGLVVGVIGGAILGAALYSINLYVMTERFEWFFAIHSTALLISHILYGAVAGAVYEMFDHYDRPFIAERPAAVREGQHV